MINNYVMLILNFFHKTKNDTPWRDIRDSKIIRKEYLSLLKFNNEELEQRVKKIIYRQQ